MTTRAGPAPDARWSKHETGQQRATPQIWFGDKLHLIADTTYELQVVPALADESPILAGMIGALFPNISALDLRYAKFCTGRGHNSCPLKAMPWDDNRILPLRSDRADTIGGTRW